ncbi:murein hydrolase activator EnvC family protein [Mangrovicella endophytica]|uniref:murein hydrolase activator EnvC family protein n=1 Tax=Mangrovicella endophytica TaxID=2066697 RepID=UPI000C9E4C3D|nr:peptidoglycan DD-metalloendopeptidase family protein [Mangrovicella endophytica]
MPGRALSRLPLLIAFVLAADLPAGAVEPPSAAVGLPAGTASPAVARSTILENERRKTADDLASIAASISLSEETVRSLDAEIVALAADRDRIRGAMIAAATKQKSISAQIADTQGRIDGLVGEESTIKASLRERRGLLAEVLGALERMGRKPPPALLVKPEDALGSVRSAILLGAVVPSIRRETETLMADLKRFLDVKREIVAEKDRFAAQLGEQREEEERLARLFAEKEKLEADNRGRREAEQRRAAELAAKATTLKELIASLESEMDSARAAEDAAAKVAAAERAKADKLAAEANRRTAEANAAREAKAGDDMPPTPEIAPAATPPESEVQVAALVPEKPERPQYDLDSLRRDATMLEPSAAFSTLKGRLTPPVSGELRTGFGKADDIGIVAEGATFAAHDGDIVTAPADGRVLYAGPFRSFGQLLILNAGDGYHVVLAGMSRTDVEVGQFVMSGEPVASMGARRLASAGGAEFGAAEPRLYVEFRKDGKPVDPAPWWAVAPSGRTRNDS